jgi:predicted MFS family arabinose efflux permease
VLPQSVTLGTSSQSAIGIHNRESDGSHKKSTAVRSAVFKRLTVSWMTLFIIGADLFAISPLLPAMATDFKISPGLAGSAVTLFSLSYMISAPVLGHHADKIGRRRVLVFCLVGFAAANLLTALSTSFACLLAMRLAAGAAAAGISPVIYALVSGCALARRRATHMGIAVSGLLVSLSIAAPGAALVGARLGWQSVFASLAAASLILAWVNRCVWPQDLDHSDPASNGAGVRIEAAVIRLIPTVIWSTALYAMFTYLGTGLTASGYTVDEIAEVILFYGIGAVGGALLGGRFADRFGARLTTTSGLVGLGCCLILARLALHCGLPSVDTAFLLVSFVAQLFFPAQQAGLARDFSGSRTTILAWNNTALFLGISLGSLIGGQVIAFADFGAELAISAALAAIGCAINLGVTADFARCGSEAPEPIGVRRQPPL